MRICLIGLLALFSTFVQGADVLWNSVEFHKSSYEAASIWWHSGKYYLDVICEFSRDEVSGQWQFSTVGCGMEFAGGVYESAIGSIIDAPHLESADTFFAYNDEEMSSVAWTPIKGNSAAEIYLAIALEGFDNSLIYGWVSFSVDDGINIINSAIDLDGGPMIVGGGSVIPEPSGGPLFLLGWAALALRRRFGCRSPKPTA